MRFFVRVVYNIYYLWYIGDANIENISLVSAQRHERARKGDGMGLTMASIVAGLKLGLLSFLRKMKLLALIILYIGGITLVMKLTLLNLAQAVINHSIGAEYVALIPFIEFGLLLVLALWVSMKSGEELRIKWRKSLLVYVAIMFILLGYMTSLSPYWQVEAFGAVDYSSVPPLLTWILISIACLSGFLELALIKRSLVSACVVAVCSFIVGISGFPALAIFLGVRQGRF